MSGSNERAFRSTCDDAYLVVDADDALVACCSHGADVVMLYEGVHRTEAPFTPAAHISVDQSVLSE